MSSAQLRRSGGSLILTIPGAYAEQNNLEAGAPVELTIVGDTLQIKPRRSRLTMAELLRNTPADAEVPGWDTMRKSGSELL